MILGSRDFTIKFFEYAKPSTKKAFKSIQEAEQIRCIKYHPSVNNIGPKIIFKIKLLHLIFSGRLASSRHKSSYIKIVSRRDEPMLCIK